MTNNLNKLAEEILALPDGACEIAVTRRNRKTGAVNSAVLYISKSSDLKALVASWERRGEALEKIRETDQLVHAIHIAREALDQQEGE